LKKWFSLILLPLVVLAYTSYGETRGHGGGHGGRGGGHHGRASGGHGGIIRTPKSMDSGVLYIKNGRLYDGTGKMVGYIKPVR